MIQVHRRRGRSWKPILKYCFWVLLPGLLPGLSKLPQHPNSIPWRDFDLIKQLNDVSRQRHYGLLIFDLALIWVSTLKFFKWKTSTWLEKSNFSIETGFHLIRKSQNTRKKLLIFWIGCWNFSTSEEVGQGVRTFFSLSTRTSVSEFPLSAVSLVSDWVLCCSLVQLSITTVAASVSSEVPTSKYTYTYSDSLA